MKYSDYNTTVQKYCTIHEKPLSNTKNNGSFKVINWKVIWGTINGFASLKKNISLKPSLVGAFPLHKGSS